MRNCIVYLLITFSSSSFGEHSNPKPKRGTVPQGNEMGRDVRQVAVPPPKKTVALPKPILTLPMPKPLGQNTMTGCSKNGKRIWVSSYPRLYIFDLPNTKPKVWDFSGAKGIEFNYLNAVTAGYQYAITKPSSQWINVIDLKTKKLHQRIPTRHLDERLNARVWGVIPGKQLLVFDQPNAGKPPSREVTVWDLKKKKAIRKFNYLGDDFQKVSEDLRFYAYQVNENLFIQNIETGEKKKLSEQPFAFIKFGPRYAYVTVNRVRNPIVEIFRLDLKEFSEKASKAILERRKIDRKIQPMTSTDFHPFSYQNEIGTWDANNLLDLVTNTIFGRYKVAEDRLIARGDRQANLCGSYALWHDKNDTQLHLYHRASLQVHPDRVEIIGKRKDDIVWGMTREDPNVFLESVETARKFLSEPVAAASLELEKLKNQSREQIPRKEFVSDSLATLSEKLRMGEKGQMELAREEMIRRWRYGNKKEKEQIESSLRKTKPEDSGATNDVLQRVPDLFVAMTKSNEQLVKDLGSKSFGARYSAPSEIRFRLLHTDSEKAAPLLRLVKQASQSRDPEVVYRSEKILAYVKRKTRARNLPMRRLEQAIELLTVPDYLKIR